MKNDRRYVRVEEADAVIEAFGPMPDGTWSMILTDGSGAQRSFETEDFDGVCEAVDRCIGEAVAADDPRRFPGYRVVKWNHETREVEERPLMTRGVLLGWYEDTAIPTPEALADFIDGNADRVIEIRDGADNLLLDRRAGIRASLEGRELEDYEETLLTALDADTASTGPRP